MEHDDEVSGEVLAMGAARALVFTDGDGAILSFVGAPDGERPPRELAEDVDVAMGAIDAFGRQCGYGPVQEAILAYPTALVAVGRSRAGRHVAMVATPETMPGLVLSQLRRLLSMEPAAR